MGRGPENGHSLGIRAWRLRGELLRLEFSIRYLQKQEIIIPPNLILKSETKDKKAA